MKTKPKKQVVVIHGGDVHTTYKGYLQALKDWELDLGDIASNPVMKGWKQNLQKRLGKGYEVYTPDMPSWMNSHYIEWQIWFEKLMPFLRPGAVFVGHSLGAIFLARYFAENKDQKKTGGVFFVTTPYRDPSSRDQLGDFVLPRNGGKLKALGAKLHFYHSVDDPWIPFSNLKKFTTLLPAAQATIFKNKGHFLQEEFPELVRDIKKAFHDRI